MGTLPFEPDVQAAKSNHFFVRCTIRAISRPRNHCHAAQSLINQIHGHGGLIFDRNEICIAASANVPHKAGKSIRVTTPAWEHPFFDQLSEFMAEVDFWNTPWATFEYIHKTQLRLDEPPRWMRSMLTSIVICGEVYCLVHSKTDQVDYVEVLPDNP